MPDTLFQVFDSFNEENLLWIKKYHQYVHWNKNNTHCQIYKLDEDQHQYFLFIYLFIF